MRMIKVGGKVLRRIRITPDWIVFVKRHAKENDTLIVTVVREAIEWWVVERDTHKTKYLAPHGELQGWSMWLPVELAKKVGQIAKADATHASSVIYTAVVLYCETVINGKPLAAVLGFEETYSST